MRRLQGRTAVVTGGGNGIGAAICQRLDAEGASVVVADIDLDAARLVAKRLHSGMAWQVDVAVEGEVKKLVAEAIKWAGSLDIYVNNAARFIFGPVDTVTDEDWDLALAVNIKGYGLGTKHAALAMVHQLQTVPSKHESHDMWPFAILNISSTGGVSAVPSMVPYISTKGAVIAMTKSCAVDLAKYKIRVNAICPGGTLTDGICNWADELGITLDQAISRNSHHMIMPRYGKPSEVAAAAAFLVSDDASFITGTILNVDGGYLAL